MKKVLKTLVLSLIALSVYAFKNHGGLAGSYSREYKEYYSADTSSDYGMIRDTIILIQHGDDFEIYNHHWYKYSGRLADGYHRTPGIVPFLGIFNKADTSISTPQGIPYKFNSRMDVIYREDAKDEVYSKVKD